MVHFERRTSSSTKLYVNVIIYAHSIVMCQLPSVDEEGFFDTGSARTISKVK